MSLRRLLERYRAWRERPPKHLGPFSAMIRKAEHALAAERLPEVVAQSRLHWWEPGDPIPTTGRRLLIGVVIWDGRNIAVLDDLEAAMGFEHPPVDHVDVFDMDHPKGSTPPSWDMLDSYIPGLHKVSTTPVAGLWVDGVLQRRGQGNWAYELLVEECGIEFPP